MPSKQGETTSIRATDGESIKHGANALKIVPALTARTQLGQILRRVRQNQERFVVNKRGEPQAVIMSVEEYVRNFARQPTALAQIQREAKSKKPNVLPLREINLEINRYRRRAVFPMLRAVLDTSVVISARLSPEGQQALILGLAIAQYFRCFVSDALREEYEGVLRRERFGLSPGSVTQSMRIIRKWATLVIPNRKLDVSRDPDARADYIVTGNTYRTFKIAPAERIRLPLVPLSVRL